MFPLFKPHRRAWRPLRRQTQLRCQASQVVGYIDIVKRLYETYGKLKSSYARQESLQRATRAHSVACEKRRMTNLCPYEIVASVVRRSRNDVVCCQRLKSVFENRAREMWAVAVEGNDTSSEIAGEVRKYRTKPCSKAFTYLRNYGCLIACQLRQ